MTNIWDMHCHVIPGVDDGAPSLDVSIEMLNDFYRNGITRVILTPHFRKGMFETSRTVVEDRFLRIKDIASRRFPGLELYPGCEFHVCMDMEKKLAADPRYRMNGGQFILLEFSENHPAHFILERCRTVRNISFYPMIAHAERYSAIRKNPDIIDQIYNMGGYVQINADSILGRSGWGIKRFCAKLLRNDRVDFVGSDAHNMTDRISYQAECFEYVKGKYGPERALRIFCENPKRIV